MSDHKKIDDSDLEEVTGAGLGDANLEEDPGNVSIQPRTGPPQPGTSEPGGSPDPESEGGGGGNQDLEI
jgi:hypothetical protein